jgi:hypothetical protein
MQTISPATLDLEVANVNAPKKIEVSWPKTIARTARSGPTPF